MRYLVYYDKCNDGTASERRAYWAHAQPPMGTITNAAPYSVLTELQARRVVSGHAGELRDTARSGVRHVIVGDPRDECFIYYVTNFFADFSAEKIRAAVRVADQAAYEKRRRERQRRRYCRIFRQ